jgi:hypothetical protein
VILVIGGGETKSVFPSEPQIFLFSDVFWGFTSENRSEGSILYGTGTVGPSRVIFSRQNIPK